MKLPKLHLRDLFWLVLVCALAVGRWVDRAGLVAANKAIQGDADLWRNHEREWASFRESVWETNDEHYVPLIQPSP